jgi:hypothetical protein
MRFAMISISASLRVSSGSRSAASNGFNSGFDGRIACHYNDITQWIELFGCLEHLHPVRTWGMTRSVKMII